MYQKLLLICLVCTSTICHGETKPEFFFQVIPGTDLTVTEINEPHEIQFSAIRIGPDYWPPYPAFSGPDPSIWNSCPS